VVVDSTVVVVGCEVVVVDSTVVVVGCEVVVVVVARFTLILTESGMLNRLPSLTIS